MVTCQFVSYAADQFFLKDVVTIIAFNFILTNEGFNPFKIHLYFSFSLEQVTIFVLAIDIRIHFYLSHHHYDIGIIKYDTP